MMKKKLPNSCRRIYGVSLLLFAMLLLPTAMQAFYVNGISYSLAGEDYPGVCYVSGLENEREFTGPLYIPAQVTYEGQLYKVSYINNSAFSRVERIESVTIEEGPYAIGNGAFYGCKGLRSINLPASITEIHASAFRGCEGLKSVTISDNVTLLGAEAFRECTNLEEATLGVNVVLGEGIFSRCTVLHKLNINSKTLTSWAFRDLTSLLEVNLGPTVETIGESCFYGCSLLKEITLPASVNTVYRGVFKNCSSLTNVKVMGTQTAIHENAFSDSGIETLYTNQETVEGFKDCKYLTTITFGDDVRTIGQYAFNGCKALVNIDIPQQVTIVGYSSFSTCTALETVTMKNVSSISANAFYGCKKLVAVEFSDNLESIYQSAFEYCDSLGHLVFPKSLKELKNYVFRNSGIKSATFQEGITTMGAAALGYCSRLEEIVLPSTITSIGSSFMMGNSALKKITAYWTTPPDGGSSTWFGFYDAILYVPEGCVDNYKNTRPWKFFKNIQTIPVAHELKAKVTISDLVSKDGEFVHKTGDVACDISIENLTANDYAGRILVKLVKKDFERDTYVDEKEFAEAPIAGNQTATLQHVFPADKTEEGSFYYVEVYYNRLNNMEACGRSSEWRCVAGSGSILMGDVNGDKVVNVADIIAIVNYVLGHSDSNFIKEAADVNGDGKVDVSDVAGAGNIILN